MIKPPYTKWINDIKTKLGFNRTMTASGEDVVDAVNKQAQQIGNTALPTAAQTLTGAIAENSGIIPFYQRIPISQSSAIASINYLDIYKYGDVYCINLDFTVGNADIPIYTAIGSYNGTLPKHTVVLSNILGDVTEKTTKKGSFTLSYRYNTIETYQALTANHRYVISAIAI